MVIKENIKQNDILLLIYIIILYDRALTEDEVKSITKGFERKYKKSE